MFLNLSVKDIELSNKIMTTENNVILYEKDVVSNLKLLKYLEENRIFFTNKLELKTLLIHQQNDIGTLYLESNELTIEFNNKIYLNYSKCRKLVSELDILLGYLNIAYKQTQNSIEFKNDNIVDITYFSTKDYNSFVLNIFALNFRNYESYSKNIDDTEYLFDVGIDYGENHKITSATNFMLTQFSRFLRLKKDQVPFSNGYGSDFKKLIQKKNTSIIQTIITEEISDFLNELSLIYPNNFNLVDIQINEREETTGAVNLTVLVYMQADDEEIIAVELEG